MSELKLCPFCGDKFEYVGAGFGKHISEHCILTAGNIYNVPDWNTRPLEDTLQQRIAELEGQVKEARSDFMFIPTFERIRDIVAKLKSDYLAERNDNGKVD